MFLYEYYYVFQVTSSVTLNVTFTPFNIFLFDVNFDKFIVGLHYFCIFFIFSKCQDSKKSIIM